MSEWLAFAIFRSVLVGLLAALIAALIVYLIIRRNENRKKSGVRYRWHFFVIDETKREDYPAQKSRYFWYKRFFWHLYKVTRIEEPGGPFVKGSGRYEERDIWQGHLEIPIRKNAIRENLFAMRFHIGNRGSETPWDGHLTLFGASVYWGHSGFRRLAERLSRCKGYKYDTRNWMIRISDSTLWWEFANHDDMCGYHDQDIKLRKRKQRRGSINLSIPEAIWGPKRYSWDDLATFQTLIKMPEDSYPVILTLQKMYFGRTKVDKSKHVVSYSVDVDAPKGIPIYRNRSSWKGDRVYGFGVKMPDTTEYLREEVWETAAEFEVAAWVLRERGRTGFVKPQPVEEH